MEGVALDLAAGNGSVQEAQVEAAVMPDQDGTLAAGGLHRLAHAAEDVGQRLLFGYRHAQRVIELDAGEPSAAGSILAPAKGSTR